MLCLYQLPQISYPAKCNVIALYALFLIVSQLQSCRFFHLIHLKKYLINFEVLGITFSCVFHLVSLG